MTLRHGHPPARRRLVGRKAGDQGSVLAALVAMLAVASILMTVATTQWSFILQREKEKELIFRGTAIARAIQEFQKKRGRAPVSLEEMTKQPQPALRQVLPDPMTARYDREGKLIEGTGEWSYIAVGTGQPGQPGQPGQLGQPVSGSGVGGRTPGIAAFIGVRSKSEELSIGGFQDSEPEMPYSEWRFQIFSADPSNMQHQQGFEPIYPPGFAGLRAPGGPPVNIGGPSSGARGRPGQQQGQQRMR